MFWTQTQLSFNVKQNLSESDSEILIWFLNTNRNCRIIYNYPLKGRWIVVDIYRDVKHRGIYPPLFTDPAGESCFSIYQIRWIKKCCSINDHNFFFWDFRETTRHFSLRSQNSEYPRLVYTTQVNSAFGARWLASPEVIIQVLFISEQPKRDKMASRFASILEKEILSMNEEAVPKSTNMATKFGVTVFNNKLFNLSSPIF